MFANALRGIGWAAMSAAGYSMLALSAPPQRRGEASGYYSGVQASGTILLPAVALWLIGAPFGGFRVVFHRRFRFGRHWRDCRLRAQASYFRRARKIATPHPWVLGGKKS